MSRSRSASATMRSASSNGSSGCSTIAPTPRSSSGASSTGAPPTPISPRSPSSSTVRLLRSRATGSSYQEALDAVVDKVERQAVDHKEKPRLRARPEEEKQILRRLADGSEGPPRERRIVKIKRFAIEPMFEEDAVARMEELGPPLLRVRERRDRAGGHPLPARRRRLRPHRAGRRRRLHEGPEPRPERARATLSGRR